MTGRLAPLLSGIFLTLHGVSTAYECDWAALSLARLLGSAIHRGVAAALEGGDLIELLEQSVGFSQSLEGPFDDPPDGVVERVVEEAARELAGAPEEVSGVLGVDVAGVDLGSGATQAPAGGEVLGEVRKLVRPLDAAGRAGEYGGSQLSTRSLRHDPRGVYWMGLCAGLRRCLMQK